MFSGLDIGDDSRADVDADVAADVDVADNIDSDHDRFQSVSGCGDKVTHSHFHSSRRGACCALCGVVVDDDQQYCGFCRGAIYGNNRKDCAVSQQGDVVQLAQFMRDGRKQKYQVCGMIMSNQLLHALNFTHRATLGGGDDKDGERGDLHPVAQQ